MTPTDGSDSIQFSTNGQITLDAVTGFQIASPTGKARAISSQRRFSLYTLDDQMLEPLWPSLAEGEIAVDYTIDARPDSEHETILWEN